MSGADRRLVIQVAAVRAAQIVAIELRRRIGNGLRHDGIVGAVEEIDLLPGQILQRIDIARRRLGVGLGDIVTHAVRRSHHAGTGGVHDRQRVAVHEIIGVRLRAPERSAGHDTDPFDHRRPGGAELNRHEGPGRDAGDRALTDRGVVTGQCHRLGRQRRDCDNDDAAQCNGKSAGDRHGHEAPPVPGSEQRHSTQTQAASAKHDSCRMRHA